MIHFFNLPATKYLIVLGFLTHKFTQENALYPQPRTAKDNQNSLPFLELLNAFVAMLKMLVYT